MEWIKKHADSVGVIVAIATAVWVINSKNHEMEMRLSKEINQVKNEIEKIQTVMIMQKIAVPEIFSSYGVEHGQP